MKSYLVKMSFDSQFVDFMERMNKKYPKELFEIQKIAERHLDVNEFSTKLRGGDKPVADFAVDDNANVADKTIQTYESEAHKGIDRVHSLNMFYTKLSSVYGKDTAEEILELVLNGSLFINDLHSLKPYCYGFDLHKLLHDGLDCYKPIKIKRAKHVSTFFSLVTQFVAYASNQLSGAVSMPSLFAELEAISWYEYGDNYMDNPTWQKEFKQGIQGFVYSMNFPFRNIQPAFTNVSIYSRDYLEALFKGRVYVFDGKEYTLNLDRMDALQKAFGKLFSKMQVEENIFTFPVITLAHGVENKEIVDKKFLKYSSALNAEKAAFNIYCGKTDTFSSCCRILNRFSKSYQNSFGVGGLSIGSMKVIGINLPRVFQMCKEADDILDAVLDRIAYLCSAIGKLHKVWREQIEADINSGLLPLYTTGWINTKRQYSTLGFIGLSNLVDQVVSKQGRLCSDDGTMAFLDNAITTEYGLEVAKKITAKISEQEQALSEEYGFLFNTEQIPAESMAVKLAEIDHLLYDTTDKIYSNQHVPLDSNVDPVKRLQVQGEMDSYTSGGAIAHINIDQVDHLTADQMEQMIVYSAYVGCVYFAVNYCYGKCKNGHLAVSRDTICKKCGEDVQLYTRVVGFITPTASWNKVRRDLDFPTRRWYNI